MANQQDIVNCSFPEWYSHFKSDTTTSIVLKLPQVFIDYLLADGLFLPDNAGAKNQGEILEDLEPVPDDEESKSKKLFSDEEFIQLKSDVAEAIAELGGKVFPKLNWSSPKDASWIAVNGSLCCETFNDICLLLKSSEFVTHDLTNPFMISEYGNIGPSGRLPVSYVMVLRQWLDVSPSGEYRCFVKNQKLIGISQRSTQHYNFIDNERETIIRKINRFFKNRIQNRFPSSSYVIDLYLSGSNRKPIIMDFNPFVHVTEGILFSWDELEGRVAFPEIADGNTTQEIVFRTVPAEGFITPDMKSCGYPLDFHHLATGEDPAKLIDLLKLQQRASSISSDSDG